MVRTSESTKEGDKKPSKDPEESCNKHNFIGEISNPFHDGIDKSTLDEEKLNDMKM